ncbi:MAG TPA: hypothetical protein VHO06_02095 [Polyangia bacterium]|nr:hypothetical protein [Polyangia bacterium]
MAGQYVPTRPPVTNAFGNAVAPGPSDFFDVPSYMDSGFPAPGGIPVAPPLGYFNWLFWYAMNGIRYLVTRGVADWDPTESAYQTGAYVQASDGNVYKLVGTATTGTQPQSDLGNWELRLKSRRAAIAQYASEIWSWLNENGQRVFGVAPDGLPAGCYDDWFENWMGADVVQINTGTGNFFGPWNYRVISTATSPLPAAYVQAPGAYTNDLTTNPWGPLLALYAFGVTPRFDLAVIESRKPYAKATKTVLVMETRICLASNGGSGVKESGTGFAVGFGDGTLVPGANTSQDPPSVYGAWLKVGNGDTTWRVVTKNGSMSSNSDTGIAIAADTPLRYRVVIIGDNATNDFTPKVLHLVNGALIANHPIDMTGKVLSPFFRATAGQGESMVLKVGRVRLQTRLDAGDQFL